MDIIRNKEITHLESLDHELRGDAILGPQYKSVSYMYDSQAQQPVLTIMFLGELGAEDEAHLDTLLGSFQDVPDYYSVTIDKIEAIEKFFYSTRRSFAAENSAMGIRTIAGETKRIADLFKDFSYYMSAAAYPEAFQLYAAIAYRSTIFTEERYMWFGNELHNYIMGSDFNPAFYLPEAEF